MSSFRKLLLRWMAILTIVSILIHITAQLMLHRGAPSGPIAIDIANRLSLDAEMSIPTWLASIMAGFGGTTAILIRRAQKNYGARLSWALLAVVLFFISVDEVAALHELLLQALHIKAGFGTTQTLAQNAWIFVVPVAMTGLVLALVFWYRNLPSRTLIRLTIGFSVYALGAVIVEYASIPVEKDTKPYTLGYTVVEEGLEFMGIWLVFRAALLHIKEFEKGLDERLRKLFSHQ